MDNKIQKFNRGSEWRKWDLHTHTPLTKLNDKYSTAKGGDVWTDFCERIERSDVEVFGITDYFSIDNYLTFKSKFRAKYQKSEKEFFPNLELRVDRSSNNRNEGYDLHLIFDNELADSKLEEFLRNLKLDNTDSSGKKIKASELKTENDFKSAFTTIPFITDALNDTFGDKKPYFVVLMAHGRGGVQPEKGNSRKNAVAEETDKRVADIYFGCDEKDRDFLLNDRGAVKKKKPCVSGSDAHSFKDFDDKVGKKFLNDGTRYTFPTWIKADLSFNGLKQIISEPKDRVCLEDEPTKLIDVRNNPTKYIDSIVVAPTSQHSPSWFDDSIALNNELVAVIGKKGSGKSALVDIIALCGKSHVPSDSYSFLKQAKFRKNSTTAKKYEAKLTWCDNTEVPMNLANGVDVVTEPERVKYLPQSFVERICNEDGISTLFQNEINNVIFSYVPQAKRLGTNSLQDLLKKRTESIDEIVSRKKDDMVTKNHSIVALEEKKTAEYKKKIEKELEDKENEYKGIKDPAVVKEPKGKLPKTEQDKLQKIDDRIMAVENEISKAKSEQISVNNELAFIEKLTGKLDALEESKKSILESLSEEAKGYGFDLSKLIKVSIERTVVNAKKKILEKKQEDFETQLSEDDTDPKKSLFAKKKELESSKDAITKSFDEHNKRYQQYLSQKKATEARRKALTGIKGDKSLKTITSLQEELTYLSSGLDADLKKLLSEREAILEKLYNAVASKIALYKEIYKPLIDFIEKEKVEQKKSGNVLTFDAGIVFNKSVFADSFLGFIHQVKGGSFQSKDAGNKQLKEIIGKYSLQEQKEIVQLTNEIVHSLHFDITKSPEQPNDIRKQINQNHTAIDVYNFIYGLEYIDVQFKILFNEKDLNENEFSPGEKGALLLIFYLLIDKEKTPLIMDQPEENLDNESVYSLLVPYIKKAKQKRQVIIVTHNPNLAVVCDAEQIIYAHMDKKKNEIRYECGSIESNNMNKRIVDVLEGTMPAFDIRDERYIRSDPVRTKL